MDPRDEEAMLGGLAQRFLKELTDARQGSGPLVHFVTAREMVNIILARCEGVSGNPAAFRDHRLKLIKSVPKV